MMYKTAFASLFLAAALTGAAAASDCDRHFAGAVRPELTSAKLTPKTRLLCFGGFAVLHSGISRTPLWSAEYLTAPRLGQARMVTRKNTFHAEERLPRRARAELEDYVRSGFDRGHMAPAGDMTTDQEQYDSFSLANIIPQHPRNNQVLWEGIEYSTRELTFARGALYVITGPIFEGETLQRLNDRVLVPTHVFKAIYDPLREEAGAYIAVNGAGQKYITVSIGELETRIGIRLFPRMDARTRSAGMALPQPLPYRERRHRSRLDAAPASPTFSISKVKP